MVGVCKTNAADVLDFPFFSIVDRNLQKIGRNMCRTCEFRIMPINPIKIKKRE